MKSARTACTEVPVDLQSRVHEQREVLIERIAELDDDLTIKYLEGKTLTLDEMKAALRRGVLDNKITPVFCGSSLKNKGIQPLLDAVVDYLPSPLDVPDVVGIHPKTNEEVLRPPDDRGTDVSPGILRSSPIHIWDAWLTSGSIPEK